MRWYRGRCNQSNSPKLYSRISSILHSQYVFSDRSYKPCISCARGKEQITLLSSICIENFQNMRSKLPNTMKRQMHAPRAMRITSVQYSTTLGGPKASQPGASPTRVIRKDSYPAQCGLAELVVVKEKKIIKLISIPYCETDLQTKRRRYSKVQTLRRKAQTKAISRRNSRSRIVWTSTRSNKCPSS